MDGTTEQRSFNSGMKGKGNENLSIRVELGKEQAEFLEKVDEKMRGLFGTEDTFEWTPMVAKSDKYDTLTAKLQVCLSGEDSALTLLKCKPGDVVEKGYGWDFLELGGPREEPPERLHWRRGKGGGEAASLENDRQGRQGQGWGLHGRNAAVHQAQGQRCDRGGRHPRGLVSSPTMRHVSCGAQKNKFGYIKNG